MSIIEKAVSKLEKKNKASAEALADNSSAVEQVLTRALNEENQTFPAAARPQAAEFGQTPDETEEAAATGSHVPDRGMPQGVTREQSSTSSATEPLEVEEESLLYNTIKIPFDQLKKLGMITPQAPRDLISEEYRAIKRPLLRNIEGKDASQVKNANLIMVTSALPGDGKTFSAINLALSIAMEQDKTVLFVDADVSKATAGVLLGIPDDSAGLIDLLDRLSRTIFTARYQTHQYKRQKRNLTGRA